MKYLYLFLFAFFSLTLEAQSLELSFEDLEEAYDEKVIPRYYYEGKPYTGKTS